MNEPIKTTENVRDFWNSRAGLGQWAGSRDVLAKELEIAAIASYVRDGMRVLDMGCGNGITAIELSRRFNLKLTGVDYAEQMVVAARGLADHAGVKGEIEFSVGDVQSLEGMSKRFDLIYTERVLVNLPDWKSQRAALEGITKLLLPGGVYVMCENSQDGLERINELRSNVSLPPVVPPWHNRYLRDAEVAQVDIPGVRLEGINYYSSTYYFLSRVVNAALAAREGKEPDYDAPVNQLARSLPSIGELGQGRIWLWRKAP
jgi:ubiquinone/menaquinone biosynthesis C-methylase UbiE